MLVVVAVVAVWVREAPSLVEEQEGDVNRNEATLALFLNDMMSALWARGVEKKVVVVVRWLRES